METYKYMFVLLCVRSSISVRKDGISVHVATSENYRKESGFEDFDGPSAISLVKGLTSFITFMPAMTMQDAGYCVQSINLIEPSQSQPDYQTAFLFTRQPSCTAWFQVHGANASDYVNKAQAASERGYIITQTLTLTKPPAKLGEFRLLSFSEYARGVKSEVRQMEAMTTGEKRRLIKAGYQLQKVFGFDEAGAPGHIGVWVKPGLSQHKRQSHYGLPFAECIQVAGTMAQEGYMLVQFQVYGVGSKPYCAATWEKAQLCAGSRIQTGTDLMAMVSEMQDSGLQPIQLSSYVDDTNVANFVILWSALSPNRYPGLWELVPAPVDYLAGSREGFLPADLAKIDTRIRNHMKKQSIMSLSYAISAGEKLKIAAAYGYSNPDNQTPIKTKNRLRIGSISKTLTSTAIYRLIEMGRLTLDRQIFGQGALLGTRYGTQPYSDKVKAIKLINLLQHTEGGWSGRENDGFPDPMFTYPQLTADQLISQVLDHHPLNFTAGEHYQYCNFGYFLLGRIIEEVTGQTYRKFMQSTIITPQNMSATSLGQTGLSGRLPNEIIYTDHDGSFYAFNTELNQADGGWVATAVDVLKFVSGVDGFPVRRDLLQPNTLAQMVAPSAASNYFYASAWITRWPGVKGPARGHDGGLSGLSNWFWRRDDGIEMSILQSGFSSPTMETESLLALNAIVDEDITEWPSHDLFQR